MVRTHRIDILIPGLFGPISLHSDEVPETPVLARLLGRADRLGTGITDPLVALLARFGVPSTPGHDLPSAPFCRLSEDLSPNADPPYLMHADPVHLRPDRDQLLLFDARHLDLSRVETDALVALFNAHFSDEGLQLDAPATERWYLRLEHPPHISTTPLHRVVGRTVAGLLPRGEDARTWVRRLNEVQMLFHQADVNRRREAEGRPTVSGVWTWGGGSLPPQVARARYVCVFARHPLARGLAAASGIASDPVPDHAEALRSKAGDVLVFWDRLWHAVLDADPALWVAQLQHVEAWVSGLLDQLKGDILLEVELDPCNGERYHLDRHLSWRFWRRPCPIGKRLLLTGAR